MDRIGKLGCWSVFQDLQDAHFIPFNADFEDLLAATLLGVRRPMGANPKVQQAGIRAVRWPHERGLSFGLAGLPITILSAPTLIPAGCVMGLRMYDSLNHL
ncbi:MAG TPA: hypothetical protein DCR93_01760 [Cytophagales bacterium]|nr:hypothetical protein [Cytophagales bacterium]HAP58278.1 hypothetical protein [Cytophagales bacterium]